MSAAIVYVDGASLAGAVSRRLAKKYRRSTTEGSRISGYPNVYPGYVVTAAQDPDRDHVAATVTYEPGRHDRTRTVTVAGRVASMHATLTADTPAGWTVGPITEGRYGLAEFTITAAQGWR